MADINKAINDLEKFRKELFDLHEWREESIVSFAIKQMKEQRAEIERLKEQQEKRKVRCDL